MEKCLNKMERAKEDFKFIILEQPRTALPIKSEDEEEDIVENNSRQDRFKLSTHNSPYQLRIKCSTIQGKNREEQLQNLVNFLDVSLSHKGIQIKVIGKSKWIIAHFQKLTDIHHCKQELIALQP